VGRGAKGEARSGGGRALGRAGTLSTRTAPAHTAAHTDPFSFISSVHNASVRHHTLVICFIAPYHSVPAHTRLLLHLLEFHRRTEYPHALAASVSLAWKPQDEVVYGPCSGRGSRIRNPASVSLRGTSSGTRQGRTTLDFKFLHCVPVHETHRVVDVRTEQ